MINSEKSLGQFFNIFLGNTNTFVFNRNRKFFEDFVFAVNKTLFPLGVYLSALDNRLLITKSNSPDENKIILSLAAPISIWKIIPAFLNKFL